MGPIALFVIPFGLAFGAASTESGLSNSQAIAMSAVVFSGAAQFAALDFWPKPGNLVAIALVVFAISARHLITGAALAPWLNQLPKTSRWPALSLLSDPNFLDSRTAFEAGERDAGVFLGGGAILWVAWVFGTTLGVFAGSQVGDLRTYGFDVVMVCFFSATLVQRLQSRLNWLPAAVATGVVLLLTPILATGWAVIVAALVGGAVGMVFNEQ